MSLKGTKFNVAIDGPAGAGKSTVARLVAQALGFVYVDTGAMYRAMAWKALSEGVTPEQVDRLEKLLTATRIEIVPNPQKQRVLVDGLDVTEEIRSPRVTQNVSRYAQIGRVREFLVHKQREIAQGKGVVMDGRDIGTHVLPDAEVKIFLTASVKERALRRFREMKGKHPELTLEQLEKDIQQRDLMDSQRAVSPLVQAPDAILIDSTGMTIDQVVHRILEICRTQSGRANKL